MLPGDYTFVQELVKKHASIVLSSGQEYLVKSRLAPIARRLGLPDLSALVEQLRREPYGPVHETVVEAMTTNETSFFRDLHPYATLKKHILPDVIQRRRVERTLYVWSAACSTGQEPYSLAMLLAGTRELRGWNVRILATDLSKNAITRAQTGVYSALEVSRGLPEKARSEHFERDGEVYRVKPAIRALIEWKQMNVAEPLPPLPVFDVVFLRNVLIYFSLPTCTSILNRVRGAMSKQGFLILGTTENMLGLNVGFESTNLGKTTVYRPARPHGKPRA